MLLTELHHPGGAGDAVLRFQRSWLVVDAGVDNPAVVPRLMARNCRLFLENGEPDTAVGADRLKRRRQPHDPTADDDKFKLEIQMHLGCIFTNKTVKYIVKFRLRRV